MKRIAGFLLIILLTSFTSAFAGELKFIDKDNLADLLGSPDIVIFDVRTARDWKLSEQKIKNAVHLTDDMIEATIKKIPKEKSIVLYCA